MYFFFVIRAQENLYAIYGSLFSGVLVVYIHSADNLNSDNAQCNPYCMLFNNRKKVKAIYIIVEYLDGLFVV